MSRPDRILSLLGLAARARNTADGAFLAETAVKRRKAFLVIVAEDAAEATRKQFSDMCAFYHVPFVVYATKDTLGHAVGKEERAVSAVCDAGLAATIIKRLQELPPGKEE